MYIVLLSAISLLLTAKDTGSHSPILQGAPSAADTLPYPIHERKGDIISDNKKSTF
ncbi:MAG: hypothetical protein WKI04_01595 [Ferruginibacter sp.]